jgi:alpha-1,2-mannosyltransferase
VSITEAPRRLRARLEPVRLPPARQLAIAAVLFLLGTGSMLFFKFRSGYVPGDLDIYRAAGTLALHGRAPYGPHFGRGLRVDLPFTYPPFAAFAVIPLALQPARMAEVTWTVVNLLLLGTMVWWLFKPTLNRFGLGHPAFMALAISAFAWTVPVAQTIAYGQVNLALAACCLVDCTRTSRRRGILVGIAAAIKLTPGLFIVYFAATKQWAAALRATATFVVCQLLAAVVLPSGSRQYWFHLIFEADRPGNPLRFFNQSLYGAIHRIGAPGWLWAPCVVVVVAAGIWRARRAHERGAEVAAVALVGLTAVLISPISWQHHAVWILMMFAVLATWATTPRRVALVALGLAAFIVPVPQIGNAMVLSSRFPPLDRIIENSDVLIYLVMLVALPVVPVTREERPSPAGAGIPAVVP